MTNIKDIPPAINTMIERSLANYCNSHGSQKFFYLVESIELLRQYFIVEYGDSEIIDLFNQTLQKNSMSRIKNYSQVNKFMNKSRKKINEAELLFQNKSKNPNERKNIEMTIAMNVSPYQQELYFIFMTLLKISGMQHKFISRELLRSPETSSFEKKKIKFGDVVK